MKRKESKTIGAYIGYEFFLKFLQFETLKN